MRIVLLLPLALFACTDGASVKLELANQTVSVPGSTLLPDGTSLRLKMIAVYLSQDVDPSTQSNAGNTAMIWVNPQCEGDLSGCNVEGLVHPAGPRVTDYFDLARGNDEIRAELQSQATAIDAGVYRYARVEMCKAMDGETVPTVPTLRWRGPGMTDEEAFTSGDCGRTSLPFDPPLEIVAGDTVQVELGYDLARAIVSGAPATSPCSFAVEGDPRCFRACVDTSDSSRACMDFPDFAPTATKL